LRVAFARLQRPLVRPRRQVLLIAPRMLVAQLWTRELRRLPVALDNRAIDLGLLAEGG
jgi:hypothetical protein